MGKKNKGKKNNPFGGKKGSQKNNPQGGKKGSAKAAASAPAPRNSMQSFVTRLYALAGKTPPTANENLTIRFGGQRGDMVGGSVAASGQPKSSITIPNFNYKAPEEEVEETTAGSGGAGGGSGGSGGGGGDTGGGGVIPYLDEEEEEEDEINIDDPSSVIHEPVTIRNPAKKKVKGGISQFATSSGRNKVLPTIKSKLLNV